MVRLVWTSSDTKDQDYQTELAYTSLSWSGLTWLRLDTFPSFRFSTIFSMSSAALSKNDRRPAFTISGPDFITVLMYTIKSKRNARSASL